jgi:hypothetical protein
MHPKTACFPATGREMTRGWSGARLARRLGVLFALLAVPSAALAAANVVTVKGKVSSTAKLLNPSWNEAKDPRSHRFTFREPSLTVRQDVRALTGFMPKELCVAALLVEGKAPAPKVALSVKIAGGRTSPVTLVVAEGQLIQFLNLDPFPHKLYDLGGKGLPPTETPAASIAQGAPQNSRNWTPPGPGKYEIRDQVTPSLRSWIVVEPRTVGVGYPDRKGDFEISLEPGKYKLRGYFNGEPVGADLDAVLAPVPADQLLKAPLQVGESVADAGTGG